MDNIYVIRGRIEELYGKHSKLFDKAFQFILAMITFSMINQNTGFMKSLSSPVISLALAVVATFLPPMVIVVIAAVLVLAHTLAASIGIFAVSAMIFLIMYIFYIRLAPKMAFVVLLTPIAFVLKIPFLVPVACALIYTPVSLVPMSCGTVVFYMVEYLKKTSSASKASGSKAMLSEITTYVQKVFQNKEMWIYIVAFIIGFFVVYTIRRRELDHAWKIGIIAGAIADVVVTAMGSIALGVEISYGSLIFGNILAAIVGMILELFLFSVDYARSERLQFEDDEYYYYVKAIPKVAVTTPEKTVKKINERQETEIIDAEAVKRLSQDVTEETKAISVEPSANHKLRKETSRKTPYNNCSVMKRGIVFKYILQHLTGYQTIHLNPCTFIFCQSNCLFYYDQRSCLYFSHCKAGSDNILSGFLTETYLSILLKRHNRRQELLFSQFFQRSSKFRLEYNNRSGCHNRQRISRNKKDGMHFKYSCKKNKSGKNDNSPK